jgi:hypothetical protein
MPTLQRLDTEPSQTISATPDIGGSNRQTIDHDMTLTHRIQR